MKPQDLIFIVILIILLFRRNPHYFVIAGLLCLIFAIPFFSLWIFFTAERLMWYASMLLFIAIILFLFKSR